MAYVAGNFDMEHVLIQWGGTLAGGAEQWSCSMRTGANTADPLTADVPSEDSVASWLASSIKDAVAAYHARNATGIHPYAKLTFVKANRIKVDGRYKDLVTHEYIYPAAVDGGGYSGIVHPGQCTLAVSLTTGVSRGPAHRGRFYLPQPSVAVGIDGLITVADADAIAGSTKTFIEAIADVPGVDAPFSQTPTVFSRKAGAAGHRKITGAEVGRVIDTQRRRRRSLKEHYSVVTADLGAF